MNAHHIIRERTDLLDPADRYVHRTSRFTLLQERKIDLTRTQNMSSDLFGWGQSVRMRFREIALEGRFSRDFSQVRTGLRMP
jgi:hypothetical protein